MKFIFIFVIALMFSSDSFSSCGDDKKVLFFANGMFNSKKTARQGLEKLKRITIQENPALVFDDYEIARVL
jgi:hypothetical protein